MFACFPSRLIGYRQRGWELESRELLESKGHGQAWGQPAEMSLWKTGPRDIRAFKCHLKMANTMEGSQAYSEEKNRLAHEKYSLL